MKRLLIVPALAAVLVQFASLPAWSYNCHDERWLRHEQRLEWKRMRELQSYGYPAAYPMGYYPPVGIGGPFHRVVHVL